MDKVSLFVVVIYTSRPTLNRVFMNIQRPWAEGIWDAFHLQDLPNSPAKVLSKFGGSVGGKKAAAAAGAIAPCFGRIMGNRWPSHAGLEI